MSSRVGWREMLSRIGWGVRWGAGLALVYTAIAFVTSGISGLTAHRRLALVLTFLGFGAGAGAIVGLMRPIVKKGVWGAALVGALITDLLIVSVPDWLDLWSMSVGGIVLALVGFGIVGGIVGAMYHYIFRVL